MAERLPSAFDGTWISCSAAVTGVGYLDLLFYGQDAECSKFYLQTSFDIISQKLGATAMLEYTDILTWKVDYVRKVKLFSSSNLIVGGSKCPSLVAALWSVTDA